MTSIKSALPARRDCSGRHRNPGNNVVPATRFTDPIAVEAWDAWFRWRDRDVLRDVTIDDTWWRVAEAVAAPNGAMAPLWAHHYVAVFSGLRLLPDERLLRAAGTGLGLESGEPLAAVLNIAAFVSTQLGTGPRFERAAFVDTAALAVHLLDDAMLVFDGIVPVGLRIGVIGFGDALHKLDIAYASAAACVQARAFATALAEGCLRGAIELAEERGARDATPPYQPERWRLREMPGHLVERAARHGVRHLIQTAIQSHPRLARLADNTTDAIDPRSRPGDTRPAIDMDRLAQREIRAAMQPWIDLPIECPGCDPAFATSDGSNVGGGTVS